MWVRAPSKILYEHLQDYPMSTEGYHEVSMPAVAAALCCEHMPTPEDKRAGTHANELSWIDLLVQEPWFDAQRAVVAGAAVGDRALGLLRLRRERQRSLSCASR